MVVVKSRDISSCGTAISDTTTSAVFPTLVAPITMCMFQNPSNIGMMNPLISEAKLDTCFLTTLDFITIKVDTQGFHKTNYDSVQVKT